MPRTLFTVTWIWIQASSVYTTGFLGPSSIIS
jgi:hypothetical protein